MAPAEDITVAGIGGPVEVLVDTWGIAHIYAQSAADLYVAQGYNAARDRLFQLDLWRRRGLGLLSEVFGEACLEQDRATRLFLYRGDMDTEWAAYGPGTRDAVASFVAGINAYVGACRAGRAPLPPEFGLLGYQPSYWEPADVARIRSHGLCQNVEQEVARARTLARFGPDVEELRKRREPAHDLRIPDGLDPSVIPEDVLRVYLLATSPPLVGAPDRTHREEGSNNWALAASRTATGRPILANDPHRVITMPSLRYLVHLSAPGLDVIGGGEPVLPGISIGHNGTAAFGFTIFPIDQEDLYVYETDPADPFRYRYGDGWEPMTVEHQDVPVPGGTRQVELRFTRHGPVIYADPARNVAFAVRATWLEPGMAPYLDSMRYMGARSWPEFLAAIDEWGAPGENQVYADVSGDIGWAPGGKVPVRPNWDGILPVPGDGRYEWDGFLDARLLPREHNPDRGWVASANQMNLPAEYDNARRTVTYDWHQSARYDRIREELTSRDAMTIEDCVALQTDYRSLPAREIVAVLAELGGAAAAGDEAGTRPAGGGAALAGPDLAGDEARTDAWSLLRGWDGALAPDSAAAALFEVWYRRHLRPALLRAAVARLVPDTEVDAALAAVLPAENRGTDARVELMLLRDPVRHFGPDGRERLAAIVTETLTEAEKEVRELLGPDTSAWRWGDLHHSRLTHPVIAALGDPPPNWATIGPLPRGGSGDTVGQTAYDPTFRQQSGASFRLVIDVGDWDNSLAMNSPGQSADPADPHYADLFPLWAKDGAFPLLYSRDKIEQHVSARYRLVPGA